jgi:hypothetical protein
MAEGHERGLTVALLSAFFRRACEEAHAEFLQRHSLSNWILSVIGEQSRTDVTATSNAPDALGASGGAVKLIALVPSFRDDLMTFLESQYVQWRKRSPLP